MAIHKDAVILRDKVYVPTHLVNEKRMTKNYKIMRYDYTVCAKCEYAEDRHSYMCDQCSAYQGTVQLFSNHTIGGKSYVGLPIGDRLNMQEKAGLPSWVFDKLDDRRTAPALKLKDLEFTGTLKPVQVELVNGWLEHMFGQLQAPPRTGKTICMTYLVTKIKKRTLILTNQKELLKQFLSEFRAFTNIDDIEHMKGKQLIGIATKVEDFYKWPITLSVYQSFISKKGKVRLNEVKKLFGLVLVDEVHRAAAHHFSKVVSKFHAIYKGGATATPKRKDGLHIIPNAIIGPVVSVAKTEVLVPRVYVHLTGCKPSRPYKIWVYAMLFLSKDKKRQELIANQAVKDVLRGHHIIIPITYVAHAESLATLINKKLLKETGKPNLAVAFHGKCDRDKILKRAKSGKIKVVIGMRSMLTGINIPIWSCLYEIAPISNWPNHYQETQRICTPMDGKKPPIIRQFIDEQMGMSVGCFRMCYRLYNNQIKEVTELGTKYAWANEKTKEIATGLLKNQGSRRGGGFEDADEVYRAPAVARKGGFNK